MTIKIMPVSDLRRRTSDVIKSTQREGEVVYITQHGRPAVVLVNYEWYETLIAQLEDLSDLASLRTAANEAARPYDEFLAELGQSQGDVLSSLTEGADETDKA